VVSRFRDMVVGLRGKGTNGEGYAGVLGDQGKSGWSKKVEKGLVGLFWDVVGLGKILDGRCERLRGALGPGGARKALGL
jgi:hypothetical protein